MRGSQTQEYPKALSSPGIFCLSSSVAVGAEAFLQPLQIQAASNRQEFANLPGISLGRGAEEMVKLRSGRGRSHPAAQNGIGKCSGWVQREAPGTSLSHGDSPALNTDPRQPPRRNPRGEGARAPRGEAHWLRGQPWCSRAPGARSPWPERSRTACLPVPTGHRQPAPGAHFSHSSSRFRKEQVESRRHACPGENATHKVPWRGRARLAARARKPHPETGFLVSCRPSQWP